MTNREKANVRLLAAARRACDVFDKLEDAGYLDKCAASAWNDLLAAIEDVEVHPTS